MAERRRSFAHPGNGREARLASNRIPLSGRRFFMMSSNLYPFDMKTVILHIEMQPV
jgi:hypothetical protein